jgi:hypothetical protein
LETDVISPNLLDQEVSNIRFIPILSESGVLGQTGNLYFETSFVNINDPLLINDKNVPKFHGFFAESELNDRLHPMTFAGAQLLYAPLSGSTDDFAGIDIKLGVQPIEGARTVEVHNQYAAIAGIPPFPTEDNHVLGLEVDVRPYLIMTMRGGHFTFADSSSRDAYKGALKDAFSSGLAGLTDDKIFTDLASEYTSNGMIRSAVIPANTITHDITTNPVYMSLFVAHLKSKKASTGTTI